MKKRQSAKRRKRARIRRIQSRIGMLAIMGVVCMLLVMLLMKGQTVQNRIYSNQARKEALTQELEQEKARTEEIEVMQKYMQSDEYIEKIAREKIGLVKENEILFKENK